MAVTATLRLHEGARDTSWSAAGRSITIGHLPVSRDGGVLFSQTDQPAPRTGILRADVEHAIRGWGGVLGDEVMAAALIDRLLHHCHSVNIRGNSYRMRNHQDLLRTEEPREGASA